ncbi:MAG: conserved rane protein of unknown function [Nitrospira sp.]|jgi:uncharacterized membrane protein|nr:conserved rane protein of unknown function [Nitrospira sp.]
MEYVVFALIWIHLLAVVVWIGGMVFLSLVLVPLLRRDGLFAQYAALFRTIAYRFRSLVWGAMGILVVTGPLLAMARSVPLTDPRHWPTIFAVKMGLVAFLFSLTLLHDLVIGPRARLILGTAEMERSEADRVLLRYSALLPRLSLLMGLLVILAAVVLARS